MRDRHNEIDKIINHLSIKEIKTSSFSNKENDPIQLFNTLAASDIGYFEWHITDKMVYISDPISESCGLVPGTVNSLYEILKNGFSENDLYQYFKELEQLFSGTSKERTLEIKFYSPFTKKLEPLRVVFVRNKGNHVISGTVHNISDYVSSETALFKSRRLLSQMIDLLPMPIIYFNEAKKLEYANKAVGEAFDLDHDKLIGLSDDDYFKLINEKLHITSKKEVSNEQNHIVYEISGEKNGSRLEILLDSILMTDENDHYEGLLYVHTDISNQAQNLDSVTKVLEANELVVKVVNMVNQNVDMDVLYETILNDIINIIPKAHMGCILRLDYNENLYIESSVGYEVGYADVFRIPFNESFAYSFLNNNFRKSVCISNIQQNYVSKFPEIDNTSRGFRLESNITAPINIDGKLYGIISIDSNEPDAFDEIDLNLIDLLRGKIEVSISRYNELLMVLEQSQLDELTGLINRKHFNKLAESLVSEAVLYKQKFSLVLVDLDGLKIINDQYGHLAGDELLRRFADFIPAHNRPEDVFARIGGDEFICLIRNIDLDSIEKKYTEINQLLLEEPLNYNGHLINIQYSFGIAEFPLDGENITQLIEIADQRMYLQKKEKYKNQKGNI